MKKAVLLCIVLFLVGLAGGFFGRGWWDQSQMNRSPKGSLEQPAASAPEDSSGVAVSNAMEDCSTPRNTAVLTVALCAVEQMKAKDYEGLSTLIHPQKGVLFAPYSTVDPEVNLTFTAQDIANLQQNRERYIWGMENGQSTPIELTLEEYFNTFVFDMDYTAAPIVGVNQIIQTGNSLENVMDVYPDAQFIEFHYPSIQSNMEGMDWCSLKVVFELYEGNYKIVALIHSQWTV